MGKERREGKRLEDDEAAGVRLSPSGEPSGRQ